LGAAAVTGDFVEVSGRDGCANATLAPKAKCTADLEFTPGPSSNGGQTGTLSDNFTYGSNNGSVSVALTGKVN
jgi:hypothetical protein